MDVLCQHQMIPSTFSAPASKCDDQRNLPSDWGKMEEISKSQMEENTGNSDKRNVPRLVPHGQEIRPFHINRDAASLSQHEPGPIYMIARLTDFDCNRRHGMW
jgi:hypothetical protein